MRTPRLWISLALCCVAPQAHTSPVVLPSGESPRYPSYLDTIKVPVDELCPLPEWFNKNEEYSHGVWSILEDCETLKAFTQMPPEEFSIHWLPSSASGTKVCCPKKPEFCLHFPNEDEPECAKKEDAALEYKSVDDLKQFYGGEVFNNYACDVASGTECKSLAECTTEDFIYGPARPCGYDSTSQHYTFCCLTDGGDGEKLRVDKDVDLTSKKGRKDYSVEDHVEECKEWAEKIPDSCTDARHQAFAFMMMACSYSCKIREKCVDEFAECQDWSRGYGCLDYTVPLSLYCRKTCANCGLLSPRNREPQVVKTRSYSDINDKAFHCGEAKAVNEDNEYDEDQGGGGEGGDDYEEYYDNVGSTSGENDETSGGEEPQDEDGVWGFEKDSDQDPPNCQFTLITDRILVTAAHCIAIGGQNFLANNANTTYFDIYQYRRSFIHPDFVYTAYNDIAIVELGKRVEYDIETRGQEPTCLGRAEKDLVGKVGTASGYGYTEAGSVSSYLIEANMTVKDNGWCAEQLRANFSTHRTNKKKLQTFLHKGLNDQLICTRGETLTNSTIATDDAGDPLQGYGDVCRGDSGGALYVQHEPGIDTIEAVVSGGVGLCGKGYPRWWIKIASYRTWITCIMDRIAEGKSKKAIERWCTFEWKVAIQDRLSELNEKKNEIFE